MNCCIGELVVAAKVSELDEHLPHGITMVINANIGKSGNAATRQVPSILGMGNLALLATLPVYQLPRQAVSGRKQLYVNDRSWPDAVSA